MQFTGELHCARLQLNSWAFHGVTRPLSAWGGKTTATLGPGSQITHILHCSTLDHEIPARTIEPCSYPALTAFAIIRGATARWHTNRAIKGRQSFLGKAQAARSTIVIGATRVRATTPRLVFTELAKSATMNTLAVRARIAIGIARALHRCLVAHASRR